MSSQYSEQPFHWHYTAFYDGNYQIRGRTLFLLVVLFAVVLLVTLLFLYARWVCLFRHLPPASHAAHNPHAPPLQSRGLDPSAINGLQIILHQSSSATCGSVDETECCICLGVFENGDKVKMLPQCRHCYHCECVDRWLSSQTSCPLCRISVRVDSALP